jgi:hypothetical protein
MMRDFSKKKRKLSFKNRGMFLETRPADEPGINDFMRHDGTAH